MEREERIKVLNMMYGCGGFDIDNKGEIANWSRPEPQPSDDEMLKLLPQAEKKAKLSDIRAQRNLLLAECDWTQTLDAPLTPEQLATWAEYRQVLRDFPATCDPNNPVWPAKPV